MAFHNPLHIRLTVNRKSIFFKSYYFTLLTNQKFRIQTGSQSLGPSLQEVESFDKEVLDYLMSNVNPDFTLDQCKAEYDLISRDLCDEMENAFYEYLNTFLNDEGMPALGTALSKSGFSSAYDVIRDMNWYLRLKPTKN